MAGDDESLQEKTEEPTPQREEKFQKDGKIPQSKELASMGILFTGLGFLMVGMSPLMEGLGRFMRATFANFTQPLTQDTLAIISRQVGQTVGISMLQMLLMLALAGLVVAYSQVGWHPKEEPISFDLNRLNPMNGFGRLFSKQSLIELVKSLFKLLIVGAIGYQFLQDEIGRILDVSQGGLESAMGILSSILYRFTIKCLGWLLVVAVLDYMWQRYSIWQEMMMTKQEIKEEVKDREGNPRVKSQMRAFARRALFQKSGLQNVKLADVVITNPDHYAIALQYTPGKMTAPKVIARGMDEVAEKIKAEARRLGIPRVENRLLARTLYKLTKVGDQVPPELYAAVAEVLAFVYRLKREGTHN